MKKLNRILNLVILGLSVVAGIVGEVGAAVAGIAIYMLVKESEVK